MAQVVKVVLYQPVSEFDIVILLLRLRLVSDAVEYFYIEIEIYILNEELGSVYFVHHINDVLLGQYKYSGQRNVFVVRYSYLVHILLFGTYSLAEVALQQ